MTPLCVPPCYGATVPRLIVMLLDSAECTRRSTKLPFFLAVCGRDLQIHPARLVAYHQARCVMNCRCRKAPQHMAALDAPPHSQRCACTVNAPSERILISRRNTTQTSCFHCCAGCCGLRASSRCRLRGRRRRPSLAAPSLVPSRRSSPRASHRHSPPTCRTACRRG